MDQAIRDRIKKLSESMGYEFVGCEDGHQDGRAVCRIYIDKDQGVTLEDCSRLSRQVSALLDVEDPFAGRFVLEVSSPGIDRPLFELAQYQKFIGRQVKMQLHSPIQQRRKYAGTLLKVEGESIFIAVDEGTRQVELPFAVIKKANLIDG